MFSGMFEMFKPSFLYERS